MNRMTLITNVKARWSARRLASVSVGLASLVCVPGIFAAPAMAEAQYPQWTVTAVALPTHFKPGDVSGDERYRVSVMNTGDAPAGGTVTVTDVLPPSLGLDASGMSGPGSCSGSTCTYNGEVGVDETLTYYVPVDVIGGEGSETDRVNVSGGGANVASTSVPATISATPAGFGIAPGSASTTLSTLQAGAHPNVTTTMAFNSIGPGGMLAEMPKDVTTDWPAGLLADEVAANHCTIPQFSLESCAQNTQVGIVTLDLLWNYSGKEYPEIRTVPVYLLEPNPGEAGMIGFHPLYGFNTQAVVSVRPGDYGLRTTFFDANQSVAQFTGIALTLWGVPSEHLSDGAAVTPFLTSPTSCSGQPLQATVYMDSWEHPLAAWEDPEAGVSGPEEGVTEHMNMGTLVGCERLAMPTTFSVEPTTNAASSPTGLAVSESVSQTFENPFGLASSAVKKTVVTLPEGMTINPSAGAGLVGCTPTEYAAEAFKQVAGTGCPSESKLGSVTIRSPLLREPLTGSLYIAEPYNNPFHSLVALYVVARAPQRGIFLKVAGEIALNPVTGQITATFDDLPQTQYTELTLSFRQGGTSPLASAPVCGSFVVQSESTPWSNLQEVKLEPSPPFDITQGPSSKPCPSGGTPPFEPQVTAGALNNNAGAFSPFDIHITREDGEQELTGFSAHLPLGSAAKLAGVPFCPNADIEQARTVSGASEEANPSCPSSSQIGTSLVGAGVGSVLVYAPGKVYLAGPYKGVPFSVVVITSAKVGPFDLGTVVVREALAINSETAQASVDPGGSDPIPHIIDGVVIHVRDIRVLINRPEFAINPTNCSSLAFTTTVDGSGADFANTADVPVTVSNPFQVANCAVLGFKPVFKATTAGKTSRSTGASLSVKLAYPSEALGKYANIAKVKVELPKQLPSRLTTLQQACTESTFLADPAECPAASRIGIASATTPILPVPLNGPAYFVSHGGVQFPELVIVLQGYGVTIELHGETFISKAGITSSTFRTIPDVPIGTFELTLPQGANSALAANANLCDAELVMPTEFVAQNGMVINQSTPVTASGCKAAIRVVRHRTQGTSATLVVSVPEAGKLTSQGSGLKASSTSASQAANVTLKVKLTKQEAARLMRHHGRKRLVQVRLKFTSKEGKTLTATTKVAIG